jgi:Zn-dependent peptidase ImmA (M78 family)/transcriptional regulator with XRE-family HTH domain
MSREQLLAVRRLFDEARLTQARELQGLLKSELADQVGVTAAAVGQFESGSIRPSTATIAQLSFVLGVSPEFFMAGRPTVDLPEERVHFRSLRSTSKRDRTQARAQVKLLAEVVGVISRRVTLPTIALPRYETGARPDAVAEDLRRQWQLGHDPIEDVVGLLERKGVIVVRFEACTDELDAFSCWIRDRPYIVLTTNKEAADRSRFDTAHELFHLVAHHDESPGDRRLEEEAHKFAAAFLMPATVIREQLPTRVDWRRFAELKVTWGVSMAALLRRALDLGCLSETSYRRGMMDMSRRKWRMNEPVSLGDPEQPVLLSKAMSLLGSARNYTLEDLASELALPLATLAPFKQNLTISDGPLALPG